MTNVAEILMGLNGDFMVCHGIIIHSKGRYPLDPFDETHGMSSQHRRFMDTHTHTQTHTYMYIYTYVSTYIRTPSGSVNIAI